MVELSKGANRIYGEAEFDVLAKAQELERQGKNILHFEIGAPDMARESSGSDPPVVITKSTSRREHASATM